MSGALSPTRARPSPAAGVAQMRYRWSVWRGGEDCQLDDLFVAVPARIGFDTAERDEAAVSLDMSFGFTYDAYEGGNAVFLRLWL